MRTGDIMIVDIPMFYSANVEFWEMRPERLRVKRFTKRKHNPVIGDNFTSWVFHKNTGRCVSHMRGASVPEHFRYARIRLPTTQAQ